MFVMKLIFNKYFERFFCLKLDFYLFSKNIGKNGKILDLN